MNIDGTLNQKWYAKIGNSIMGSDTGPVASVLREAYGPAVNLKADAVSLTTQPAASAAPSSTQHVQPAPVVKQRLEPGMHI